MRNMATDAKIAASSGLVSALNMVQSPCKFGSGKVGKMAAVIQPEIDFRPNLLTTESRES